MRINELRIGNWVSFVTEDNYCKVSSISDDYSGSFLVETDISSERGLRDYSPIPLTEEWLLRFGFSKWKNKNNFSKGSFIAYTLSKKGFHFGKKSLRVELKYVHQLQNLYFALTGKELR